MDDMLGTLKSIRTGLGDQYSGAYLSGATLSVPKVGKGYLHGFFNGGDSCPTLTIYDAASGSSGTIIALQGANAPRGFYTVDVAFTNGLSCFFQTATAADQPAITVSYK